MYNEDYLNEVLDNINAKRKLKGLLKSDIKTEELKQYYINYCLNDTAEMGSEDKDAELIIEKIGGFRRRMGYE